MDRLHSLADELREVFSERGHAIDKALSRDVAFRRTKRPKSTLVRELVLTGVEGATTKLGLSCIPVVGGSCDVQDIVEGVDRRFRVLKAGIAPETGEYDIVASSDAILTVTEAEPDALFPTERWVLGYTVDDEGMLVDLFAAKVLGLSEDSVPRLVLGPVTELGLSGSRPTPTGGGFHPVDEDDLEGMDAGEVGEDEDGLASGA
ncbi:hypothetical protein [Terrabacter sp. C0L_2]|uniref:hypothetical protein n=1 Tax=Terrabacter sp. C0L_2 TaxID=3108389 RepID=UPI002ED11009|nr:hypothetical protein U5C87_00690 [Terrabacter sp. C0L_2]